MRCLHASRGLVTDRIPNTYVLHANRFSRMAAVGGHAPRRSPGWQVITLGFLEISAPGRAPVCALAASVAAGVQLTPSLASAPASAPLAVSPGAVGSGGALFFLLAPAANRFSAGSAGLVSVRAPILRLAP